MKPSRKRSEAVADGEAGTAVEGVAGEAAAVEGDVGAAGVAEAGTAVEGAEDAGAATAAIRATGGNSYSNLVLPADAA